MAETRLQRLQRIVAHHQCERIEGTLVDATSASVALRVHDALNAENRERLMALPLSKMMHVVWKLVA